MSTLKPIKNIVQEISHQVVLTDLARETLKKAWLDDAWEYHEDRPEYQAKWWLNHFDHQLQKARHDWLREEIVKLEERQRGWLGKEEDGSDRHPNYDELQTIIDRYLLELESIAQN